MKKLAKISLVLIGCLCLSCSYPDLLSGKLIPFAKTIQIAEAKETESAKTATESDNRISNKTIEQTVETWATAYCDRDGNTLYQLFHPDNKTAFFQLTHVNSGIEDSYISFGMSSPWPWETDFSVNIEGNTAHITYYAMTSDPHVYTWIETLKLAKKDGLYYVSSEKIKKYDAVKTKKELLESIHKNFVNGTNKLDYISSGLSFTLNQNAVNNKKGDYAKLFSAETAAPYLLNLSSGKSTVKKKYLTCTIVTYTFKNGDSVNIQMTQPFGKKGIWLVEDVGASDEKNIKTIESWYQKQTIKSLNKIKKITDSNDIFKASEGSTLLLASIPKEKVYLYGYAGGNAVILRVNDKYQLFRWAYTSPRGVLPKLGYGDYDQDGKKEIAVSLCTGTGTGFSVDQLYLVKTLNDGTLSAMEFNPAQYNRQLTEKITATFKQTEGSLQFYINKKKAGNSIDLSSWMKEGYQYSRIGFGEQISFEISNKAITLNVVPGCYFENVASPQYDEMPTFTAKVVYKQGDFSVSGIKVKVN